MLDQIALFARDQTIKHENADPSHQANLIVGRLLHSYDTPKELILRADNWLGTCRSALTNNHLFGLSAFGADVLGWLRKVSEMKKKV